MNSNKNEPHDVNDNANNSPEATPRRPRSNITPTPLVVTPKYTTVVNSISTQSFQGNLDYPNERSTKYFIVNPHNSPVGNPSTPESAYAASHPDTVNLPDIVISSAENSLATASLERNNSDELIEIPQMNKISLQSTSVHPPPEKILKADAPNDSTTPRDAESSLEKPANDLPGSSTAAGRSVLQGNSDQPPGYPKHPSAGSFPRNPGDIPLPDLSRMSLGLTPVSYRSSVFYLAITKFISVPFIIFLFFIVRVHGKKPLGLYLSWMIVAMLVLQLIHGCLLLYGALEKKLGVIKLCIWITMLMGSYTSSIGAMGVMTFLSLAHYTLQFFFVFVFVVLVCNIFTVICCDIPVLICYKHELQGDHPMSRYPGLWVNYMFCRI